MSENLPSLFVIGNSSTILFGPHLKRMLHGFYVYSRKGEEPAEIRSILDDLGRPQGASAGNSSMVVDYLHALDRTGVFGPDVVLLSLGMRDLRRDAATGRCQVSLEDHRGNVVAIVDWFRDRGITLVWITSGPLDEAIHNALAKDVLRYEADVDAYNAAAEAIVRGRGVPLLDMRGFLRNLGPMSQLVKDHMHLKDEFARLQAAFIAGYLTGMGEPVGSTER